MPIELIIPIVIALLVIITIYQGLCIVQQSQTVIVERLGKYYRTLSSGVNIIIPFIDRPLVGSEMCIRDSQWTDLCALHRDHQH